ncbi:MAG: DUF4405 domain-containing protein [Phycisphaeraceae bacterium]|nr:DUF4405 domain-containing protein [Phycisphaeraceae bacterium]
MKRATLYWWLDSALGLTGLGVLMTGLLMEFVLPAHSRSANVWGWTRHDWGELHFMLALGVLVLIGVHLLLHWGWVCTMSRKVLGGTSVRVRRGGRWLAGAAAVAVVAGLVGGFLWLASVNVQDNGGQGMGLGRGRQAGQVDGRG